jgi:short-subunit dehydrogenase
MVRRMSGTEQKKVVWITGASSGIGAALALSYARDGHRVAATARNVAALQELAEREKNISVFPGDVTDAQAMAATVAKIEHDLGGIDLAILNAGIFLALTAARFDGQRAKTSMAVNYVGVVNCLEPVLRAMIARERGQIAFMSSVAGYRGLPTAAAYAPTKAALISLAESLHAELALKGIRLSVINPGFVATPLTDTGKIPMPGIISVDEASDAIRKGLERERFEIVFPTRVAITMKILRLLPYRLFFRLVGKGLKRSAANRRPNGRSAPR